MNMPTVIAAGEPADGPGWLTPDWLSAWGSIAAAVIALAAMVVSIVLAVKSGRDANKASEALNAIAKAQKSQADEDVIAQARQVFVEWVADRDDGQQGFAVRNANPTSAVDQMTFDFADSDDELEVFINEFGITQPADAPIRIAQLGPGETTAKTHLFNKVGGQEMNALLQQARIRFRDGRSNRWERIGNGEPVRI